VLQYVAVCCSVIFIPKGLYKSPIYSNMGIKSLCKEPYLYQRALFIPKSPIYTKEPNLYQRALFIPKSPIYTKEPYLYQRALFIPKSPIYTKEPYLYQRALFTPIGLYAQSPTNATNSPMYTRRALCTHRITQEPNS